MIEFQYNSETKSFAMTTAESMRLIEALKSNYPEITFYSVKAFENACYMSARATDIVRKACNEDDNIAAELSKVFGLTVEQLKTIRGHCVIYGKNFAVPEILAHELGHYEIETKGKVSHICQKYLHPNQVISKINRLGYTLLLYIDPSKSWIAGAGELLTKLPQLYYEKRASQKGLKMIKKLSKDLKVGETDLKSMKKSLGGAWGTYVFSALTIPIAATFSTMVTKLPVSPIAEAFNLSNSAGRSLEATAAGLIGMRVARTGWNASAKKMDKESGKRRVNILGLFEGKGNFLKKLNSIKSRSRVKTKSRKINSIIDDFQNRKLNGIRANFEGRAFSIGEPISEMAKPKKSFHVISTIEGNIANPGKRTSVVQKSAKTPQEAEKMVRDMNLGRVGASKYKNLRAFETPKMDFQAQLYKQSLDREVERSKQLKR